MADTKPVNHELYFFLLIKAALTAPFHALGYEGRSTAYPPNQCCSGRINIGIGLLKVTFFTTLFWVSFTRKL